MYVGPRWRVAHASGTSLPGWLVVLPRRHVIALDELTAEEAADLGPLLRALTAALREVLGCSKTYVALFAEAEGFAHVHFHVVPRSPDLDQSLRGPRVFGLLGGDPAGYLPDQAMDQAAAARAGPRWASDQLGMSAVPQVALPGAISSQIRLLSLGV